MGRRGKQPRPLRFRPGKGGAGDMFEVPEVRMCGGTWEGSPMKKARAARFRPTCSARSLTRRALGAASAAFPGHRSPL